MSNNDVPGKGKKGWSRAFNIFFLAFMGLACVAILFVFITIMSEESCSCLPAPATVQVERVNATHISVTAIDVSKGGQLKPDQNGSFYQLYSDGNVVPASYIVKGPGADSPLGSKHYYAVRPDANVTVIVYLDDFQYPVWNGKVA